MALHDVDGPVYCASGEKIRLQGIGATELNGTCNPNQPCVPGDPFEQRRRMAKAMGAKIDREDVDRQGRPSRDGRLWFKQPVRLTCETTGRSYSKLTAWCSREDGSDLSCLSIRSGLALRWERYDERRRLVLCSDLGNGNAATKNRRRSL